MDTHLQTAFLDALAHVFDTLFQLPVETHSPAPRSPFDDEPRVSGLLTLAGDLEGVVLLSTPIMTAQRLASLLVGEDVPPDDHDRLSDAVAEILEMIAGAAAASLQPGLGLTISPHGVAVGRGQRRFRASDQTRSIPCRCEAGELTLDLAVSDRDDLAPAARPAAPAPRAVA